MERGERLIKCLQTEEQRWITNASQATYLMQCLEGNMLMASAIINYLGMYNIEERKVI